MTAVHTDSRWRLDPATQAVMAALDAGSGAARFVGGCVRNTLLGIPVTDIDIATVHAPGETMRRLTAAGLGAKPTGIAHGTVTAIADHRPFEITTLRRDVETDGRHAVVAFTDDWAEDAARRDLTMNALFMDFDGRIFDPVGGRDDAMAGRVRFVGDPEQRILEDVLRVLRFFRFQAQYGRVPPDPEGLDACARHAESLTTLSGERIRAELLKLLGARQAAAVVRLIRDHRILAALFPGTLRIEVLEHLIALEDGPPDPLLRLAGLLTARPDSVSERLRFSRAEATRFAHLAADRVDLQSDARSFRARLYTLGTARFLDAAVMTAAIEGADDETVGIVRALARDWSPPRFPLRGADLLRLGLAPGDRIGRLLAETEAWWIAGDFTADRKACLEWARTAAGQGRDIS